MNVAADDAIREGADQRDRRDDDPDLPRRELEIAPQAFPRLVTASMRLRAVGLCFEVNS
jgi:hypothetical protein